MQNSLKDPSLNIGKLVSIIVATFNGEKYLHQQIGSILEQTYKNIEIIVVDDASTDKTLSILYDYAVLDGRIHIYPNEINIGLIKNFERGICLAKGEFIAFSDQDDIFREDKIELQVEAFRDQSNCDMVVSDLSLINESNHLISESMWRSQRLAPQQGHPFERLLYKNFATGCAMMIRRRLLDICLPFPPDCLVHDWWLAVMASSEKGGGIHLISRSLTAYRQHERNLIGARAKTYTTRLTIQTLFARFTATPRVRGQLIESIADSRRQIKRLKGYLRWNCWSQRDRISIQRTLSFYQRLFETRHSNIVDKLVCAWRQMKYARMTGRTAREIAEKVYFIILPYK